MFVIQVKQRRDGRWYWELVNKRYGKPASRSMGDYRLPHEAAKQARRHKEWLIGMGVKADNIEVTAPKAYRHKRLKRKINFVHHSKTGITETPFGYKIVGINA